VQNQAFYRTGIFGNFFFGGGNFAFSKWEFPVALAKSGLSVREEADRRLISLINMITISR